MSVITKILQESRSQSTVTLAAVLTTVALLSPAQSVSRQVRSLEDVGQTLAKLEKQQGSAKKKALAHLEIANIYARHLHQYHIALDAYGAAIAEAERNTKAKERQRVLREARDGYSATLESLLQSIEAPQQTLEVAMKSSSKYYSNPGDSTAAGVKIPKPRFLEVLGFDAGYCLVNLKQGSARKRVWFQLKNAEDFRHETGRRLSADEMLDAYADFLELAGTSKYGDEVRQRRDDLVFEKAAQKNTLDSLEAYLTEFSDGRHRREASEKIEELVFQKANKENSVTAYESYLERYPHGQFLVRAKERLEYAWFREARERNEIAAFQEYLEAYPEGAFSAEAKVAIKRIEFEQTKASGSIEVLENFIRRNPTSAFATEAQKAIEEIYLSRAKEEGTTDAYGDFLRRYPDSALAEEARWLLAKKHATPQAYSEFLDTYENSIYRPFAETMVLFFQARESTDIEVFERFFRQYEQSQGSVSSEQREQLLARLLSLSAEQESAAGYLIVYKFVRNIELLRLALPHVKSKEQEDVIVKAIPARFFRGDNRTPEQVDMNISERNSFWLSNPIRTAKPVYRFRVRSWAEYGTYAVRIKLVLNAEYKRRYRGITWFEPEGAKKDWEETHVAYGEVTLRPGSTEWVEFRFPRISAGREFGSALAGTVTHAEVEAELPEIVSVSLR